MEKIATVFVMIAATMVMGMVVLIVGTVMGWW